MAPTEVLASQHYEELQRMLDTYHLDYSAQLLTGSTKKKAAIYKKICSGKIQLLVGTHAVITEKVDFLILDWSLPMNNTVLVSNSGKHWNKKEFIRTTLL